MPLAQQLDQLRSVGVELHRGEQMVVALDSGSADIGK